MSSINNNTVYWVYLYDEPNCGGAALTIMDPSTANPNLANTSWGDRVSSISVVSPP